MSLRSSRYRAPEQIWSKTGSSTLQHIKAISATTKFYKLDLKLQLSRLHILYVHKANSEYNNKQKIMPH